ncbi:MAG: FAD-binding protein, partial [Clostridia bacterium]
MSSHKYKGFEPKWQVEKAPEKSYRAIFKWGDPDFIKTPRETLFEMMKQKFHMTDNDFQHFDGNIGLDNVSFDIPIRLKSEDISFFESVVGKDYVKTDDFSRLSVAYGKTMYDLLRLRKKIVENVPDVVIYPNSKDEIEKIVNYCSKKIIPVYVYGGGSSVTRGVECNKGGIS